MCQPEGNELGRNKAETTVERIGGVHRIDSVLSVVLSRYDLRVELCAPSTSQRNSDGERFALPIALREPSDSLPEANATPC
jgi:hypothetical protein